MITSKGEKQNDTSAIRSDEPLRATSTEMTEQAAASPLAQSAETSTASELLKLEPTVSRGAQILDELPASYLETRVTVMPRDADTIVVYWDVAPETANAYPNARWGISVAYPSGRRVVEIQHGARNWYIRESDVARRHEVFFGPLDDNGNVIPLARGEWQPNAPDSADAEFAVEWGRGVVAAGRTTLEPGTAHPVVDTASLVASSERRRFAADSPDGNSASPPHSATWNRA